MYSKKFVNYTPPSKVRPKVLRVPHRSIRSSGHTVGDLTPHFKNVDLNTKSMWALPASQDVPKPPKYLPPLQPLLHSPRAHGKFVFKSPGKKEDAFLTTFSAAIAPRQNNNVF